MHSSNEVTQRYPQDTLHQPQKTNSLRETGDNTMHMVFEGEPAVKLHTKNVKVEAQMETPDKNKSPWGGFSVLDLLLLLLKKVGNARLGESD